MVIQGALYAAVSKKKKKERKAPRNEFLTVHTVYDAHLRALFTNREEAPTDGAFDSEGGISKQARQRGSRRGDEADPSVSYRSLHSVRNEGVAALRSFAVQPHCDRSRSLDAPAIV
ncbi:hypothetical protein MRX96_023080 [Rhipicephalus microplus]